MTVNSHSAAAPGQIEWHHLERGGPACRLWTNLLSSPARQAQQAKPHGGTLSKHLGMTSTLIFGVGQASIFCDLKLLDYIWIILDAFGWLNRLSVNPFSTLSLSLSPLELTVATHFLPPSGKLTICCGKSNLAVVSIDVYMAHLLR